MQKDDDKTEGRDYIEEEISKKNAELGFANEFLLLARELYSISLLSLEKTALVDRMVSVIRERLELLLVGVMVVYREDDSGVILSISKSDSTIKALRKNKASFKQIKISEISKRPILKKVLDGQSVFVENIGDIWGGLIDENVLNSVSAESGIQSMILRPLLTEEKSMGIFMCAFGSSLAEIPELEKEELKSFADIIALAMDKAEIYQRLQEVNQSLVSANVKLVEANEELKTIDATKSAILSSASHHLQNPLQDIVMGTSMLLDGSFGEISVEAKKAVAQIFEASRHLTITFKMWLKALDFENDRVQYNLEEFNLAELVEKTAEEWKTSAEERGLQMLLEKKATELCLIKGDKEWMREVIVNLIDNALKMTEKGFVKIKTEKIGKEKVKLTVEDTGVGMSEETMKKLFQKFDKGKEGWKKDIYGTGLGLYLCKKIVEEGHMGKIYASSDGLGKGALFTVELPAL